jgi:hypothetical protein
VSPGNVADALIRRWYIVVVALLLTAAGGYHVYRPASQYAGSAVVVLKPPVTGNQPNQLANLQPPLAVVSYAVIQQLESPAGQKELSAAGVRGTYHLVPRNSGTSATPRYLIPSLQVQSQASGPDAAETAVRRIIEIYTQHVEALQTAQGVPSASRITPTVLVAPSAAKVLGTKSRALAGVAMLGGAGGIIGALWFDQYALRRRTKNARGPRRHAGGIPVAG